MLSSPCPLVLQIEIAEIIGIPIETIRCQACGTHVTMLSPAGNSAPASDGPSATTAIEKFLSTHNRGATLTAMRQHPKFKAVASILWARYTATVRREGQRALLRSQLGHARRTSTSEAREGHRASRADFTQALRRKVDRGRGGTLQVPRSTFREVARKDHAQGTSCTSYHKNFPTEK